MQSTNLCTVHLYRVYWSSCLYMIDKLGKKQSNSSSSFKILQPSASKYFFIIKTLIVLQILDIIFDKKKFINSIYAFYNVIANVPTMDNRIIMQAEIKSLKKRGGGGVMVQPRLEHFCHCVLVFREPTKPSICIIRIKKIQVIQSHRTLMRIRDR